MVHPKQVEVAQPSLERTRKDGLIVDLFVTPVGDDLELMTHRNGEDNKQLHEMAWETFVEVTERVSKPLKLYGAGQDLLADSFSGNAKGMGPGVAEFEFEERKSDPVLVFMADETEPGAWNLLCSKSSETRSTQQDW